MIHSALTIKYFFFLSAKRDVIINLGEPFGTETIERSMLPLKFYHDFNCEIESYSYAFGPCWEPVIAQCNLSKFLIFKMGFSTIKRTLYTEALSNKEN